MPASHPTSSKRPSPASSRKTDNASPLSVLQLKATLEKRLAERTAELDRTARHLAAIVESSADAIYSRDLNGKIVSWNPGAENLYRYSAREMIGRPNHRLIPREHREEMRRIWRRVDSGETIHSHETVRRRKDGRRLEISFTSSPLRDVNRRIIGAAVIAHDITPRIQMERELHRVAERLELAHSIAKVGTYEWNVRTGAADCSPSMGEIYGLPPGKTLRRHSDWARRLHPEDAPRVLASLKALFKHGSFLDLEYRIVRPDGQARWLHSRGQLFRDARNRPLQMIGAEMDVTPQKQAADALRQSEAQFRLIVEHAPVAMVMVNAANKIVLANEPAAELFGYRRDQLLGHRLGKLIPGRFRRAHTKHAANFLAHPGQHRLGAGRDLLALRKDGTEVTVEIGLSPIQMTEGRFVMATIFDITERKRAQELLSRANEILEQRVHKRTTDLQRLNTALRHEVAERRRLQHQVLEISERERRRIGADLHDGLGQQLTGVAMLTDALAARLKEQNRPETKDARRLATLLRQAHLQSRRLAHGLQPVPPEPKGLMDALARLAEAVSYAHRVRCRFQCSPPVLLADNIKATHLFRIAQEAVNNAIRHGRCRQIELWLAAQNGSLRLEIRDDGRKRFPLAARQRGGFGLQIMKSRSEVMGGILKIRPLHPQGAAIACVIPV